MHVLLLVVLSRRRGLDYHNGVTERIRYNDKRCAVIFGFIITVGPAMVVATNHPLKDKSF